jgi:hypothetical protein
MFGVAVYGVIFFVSGSYYRGSTTNSAGIRHVFVAQQFGKCAETYVLIPTFIALSSQALRLNTLAPVIIVNLRES